MKYLRKFNSQNEYTNFMHDYNSFENESFIYPLISITKYPTSTIINEPLIVGYINLYNLNNNTLNKFLSCIDFDHDGEITTNDYSFALNEGLEVENPMMSIIDIDKNLIYFDAINAVNNYQYTPHNCGFNNDYEITYNSVTYKPCIIKIADNGNKQRYIIWNLGEYFSLPKHVSNWIFPIYSIHPFEYGDGYPICGYEPPGQ